MDTVNAVNVGTGGVGMLRMDAVNAVNFWYRLVRILSMDAGNAGNFGTGWWGCCEWML